MFPKPILFLALAVSAAAESPFSSAVVPVAPKAPNGALCSPCFQLAGQSLNILINEALNEGVLGGCAKLCSHLKTNSSQKACDLVCGIAGIKVFIKALTHADLDPIYFCELIKTCPAGDDNAAVSLVGVEADPASIKKGDTITLALHVNVTHATGVGEFGIRIEGPVTAQIGQRFLLPAGIPAGLQDLKVNLQVQDAGGQQPVTWNPGNYKFTFEVCQGECGSKHPHSKFFGETSSNFTLTAENLVFV